MYNLALINYCIEVSFCLLSMTQEPALLVTDVRLIQSRTSELSRVSLIRLLGEIDTSVTPIHFIAGSISHFGILRFWRVYSGQHGCCGGSLLQRGWQGNEKAKNWGRRDDDGNILHATVVGHHNVCFGEFGSLNFRFVANSQGSKSITFATPCL